MKIAVIGYSGAGKSTLAKSWENYSGVRFCIWTGFSLNRDGRNGTGRQPGGMAEDFLDENENRGWIIDGNYTGVQSGAPVKGKRI